MNKIKIVFFIFIATIACQPIEKIDTVVFDNNQLSNYQILSKSIESTM